MAKFKVLLTTKAEKQLDKLSNKVAEPIFSLQILREVLDLT